jgi:hypothetical protein
MVFDYEPLEICKNPATGQLYPIYYNGQRYTHTIQMHRAYANHAGATGPDLGYQAYHMRFPPQENVFYAICQKANFKKDSRPFVGHTPFLKTDDFLRR